MSKQINKLITGFLILVVIVAAVTSFREGLLNDGASYDAFVSVFDCFPFAKEMAEVAANIGQYGTTLQGLSPSNFLDDIAKIFAMSIVCPILIGGASALFLKVPNYRDWYDREQYMRGIGYRLKECLLSVIMMPVCAYITAYLMEQLQLWLRSQMPLLGAGMVSMILAAALFGMSVLMAYIVSPRSIGIIIRHRLIVDLLGGILKIVGMNFLCFLIALAILNDNNNAVLGLIITLLIYLGALELIIGSIMS